VIEASFVSPEPPAEPSEPSPPPAPQYPTELVTLLFTDIVGALALKEDLGDTLAVSIIKEHRDRLRDLLKRFPDGEEIETAGDSFLLLFKLPSQAVHFALSLVDVMRQLSEDSPKPVRLRTGMHLGEIVVERRADPFKRTDVYGSQVDLCCRVMQFARE